jgi:hypothetical protein
LGVRPLKYKWETNEEKVQSAKSTAWDISQSKARTKWRQANEKQGQDEEMIIENCRWKVRIGQVKTAKKRWPEEINRIEKKQSLGKYGIREYYLSGKMTKWMKAKNYLE